jgi:hypothetical protein
MDAISQIEGSHSSNVPHRPHCRCQACLASIFGGWIDALAEKTSTRRWQIFGTSTFRTPDYPWQRGFPTLGSYKPSPQFVHRTFERLIQFLETDLHSQVEYVVADQLGNVNGRLHQHFILASRGLDEYPRNKIWAYLLEHAGYNRILPFERGAAYYVGRYIGKAVRDCEWDVRISSRRTVRSRASEIGKVNLVLSVDMPKGAYKNTRKGWHR